MAAKLTFVDPLEGEIEGFPLETLLQRIEEADPAYWNAGAGGGLLYRGPVDRNRTMEIYLVPGRGFHLICDTGGGPLAATLRDVPDCDPVESILVGGDPMRISRRQCLPIQGAAAVIACFAEHGRRAPDYLWLPKD